MLPAHLHAHVCAHPYISAWALCVPLALLSLSQSPRVVRNMVASEGAPGPVANGITYASAGAVVGGIIGGASTTFYDAVPASQVGTFMASKTVSHAATFAAIAGIFGVTEGLLETTRGHHWTNTMAAGCAARRIAATRVECMFREHACAVACVRSLRHCTREGGAAGAAHAMPRTTSL